MKKSFLIIAAALFILAGCQKEESVNESTLNNVIHIGVNQIAPPTKVAADDIAASTLTFKWEEDDQVSFTDNDNYERIIIYTCTNPATGEFSGEALDPDATYWVEYPNDYSGTFIYRGNQIPKGHLIMNEEVSGSATTFTLDTHNPIIHFKLKGDAKIGKIKLSNAQESQPIYTLSCGDEGVQLSDEPIDFYMDAQDLDPHRLDSPYTLSIRDTQDAELKSVSFHLKAENLGTIVDFATPIEVNATTGTAKAKIGGSQVDVNWVQLWENGPKFAEYNVGAENSKAEDYGGYYCWGGSYENGTGNPWNDGHNTGDNVLSGDNDTATNLWGENWRMPTKAELEALLSNCNVAWTTVGGVNGRKFTGKGAYASNSVFLPAAGNCDDVDVGGQGYYGMYWSSTPDDSLYAYYLNFNSGSQGEGCDDRDFGYSVRAVLAE